MRLGFHYHIPALVKNENIYISGYFGRFIDGLALHCDKLVLFMHTPMPEEETQMDYKVISKNVELIDIGLHSSLPNRLLQSRKIIRIVQQRCFQLDCMLIRCPTPLLSQISKACTTLPISLLIVGDQLAGINDLPQPPWRKEAIRLWWMWNNKKQLLVARRSLTFVNSHQMFEKLQGKVPNLIETRTTTLQPSDFYFREDTCQSRPIRLLYAGRMDRTKGILDIIKALGILIQKKMDVTFDLVGQSEHNDPLLEDIKKIADSYGINDRIHYYGYQPFGPKLFSFFKEADIFIVASQSTEGFPRSIWEALAHSLPVVATRVGSIPDYLRGAAELVEPRSEVSIASGIEKIIKDQAFRQEIIIKGRKIAQENTVEKRSQEMIGSIKSYLMEN